MLNKILLSLILFLFVMTVPVFAKTETFDIATFTAPTGWKEGTKHSVVSLSKISGNGTRLQEGA